MVITPKSSQFGVGDLGILPNMYTKESYEQGRVIVEERKQVKLPTLVNPPISVVVSLTTLAGLQFSWKMHEISDYLLIKTE